MNIFALLLSLIFSASLCGNSLLHRRVSLTSCDQGVHVKYEHEKPDDIYYQMGAVVYPAAKAIGIYSKVGYTFKMSPDKFVSPYAVIHSAHSTARGVSGGVGIKSIQHINSFISIGAEVHGRLAMHVLNLGIVEIHTPIIFHLGKDRNIDFEVIPSHVYYFGAAKGKASSVAGAIGYRF